MDELQYWKTLEYLTLNEALHLIMGLIPGTSKLPKGSAYIYKMLEADMKAFKLPVYFFNMWVAPGKFSSVNTPEVATEDTMHYFLHSIDEYLYGSWWLSGKLSANDLKQWLKDKGIVSSFFETKAKSLPLNNIEKKEDKYLHKIIGAMLDTAVKKKGKSKNIVPVSNYSFNSETELIIRLSNEKVYGIGKSNLQTTFSNAKRALNNNDIIRISSDVEKKYL